MKKKLADTLSVLVHVNSNRNVQEKFDFLCCGLFLFLLSPVPTARLSAFVIVRVQTDPGKPGKMVNFERTQGNPGNFFYFPSILRETQGILF